jgi:hypothetical protein
MLGLTSRPSQASGSGMYASTLRMRHLNLTLHDSSPHTKRRKVYHYPSHSHSLSRDYSPELPHHPAEETDSFDSLPYRSLAYHASALHSTKPSSSHGQEMTPCNSTRAMESAHLQERYSSRRFESGH